MKAPHFLLLLFVLNSLNLYSQREPFGKIIIEEPEIIGVILFDFIEDSKREGLTVTKILSQHLGGIRVMSVVEMFQELGYETDGTGGVIYLERHVDFFGYTKHTPMIVVRKDFINHLLLAKVIVYHELGHFFGLEHNKSIIPFNIMNPIIFTANIRVGYYSEEEIEKAFRVFFHQLKNNNNRNHFKKK